MVLGLLAVAAHLRAHLGLVQNGGEVQPLGLPVGDRPLWLQYIGAPHHLIDGAEAQLRHDFPHILGNEAHKINHVVRVPHEVLAQFWILGGHPHRTGIQVTDSHHDAAQGYQGSGGKTKLLRPQQGSNHHIPPGFHLAIRLHHHPATQVVEHQGLVGFRQAQFPG